jgi:hypothetical protein
MQNIGSSYGNFDNINLIKEKEMDSSSFMQEEIIFLE